jgi:hypothetical protein
MCVILQCPTETTVFWCWSDLFFQRYNATATDICQVFSTPSSHFIFILVVGQGKVPPSILNSFELQFKLSGPQPGLKMCPRAMDSMRLPLEEFVMMITFHGSDLRAAKRVSFLSSLIYLILIIFNTKETRRVYIQNTTDDLDTDMDGIRQEVDLFPRWTQSWPQSGAFAAFRSRNLSYYEHNTVF